MELWDIYDVNRSKTDRTWVRGEKLEPGDFHLVIHICIFNSNGEMLIQQRQSFKEGWPNLWDLTAGGSAVAGDTSQTAAQRELHEEIGLIVDFECIRPHLTINFENGFDDIYLIQEDVQLHKNGNHVIKNILYLNYVLKGHICTRKRRLLNSSSCLFTIRTG